MQRTNKLLSFEPWKKVSSRCRRLYRSENRPWSPFPFLGDKSSVWSDTDRSESGHQVVPRGCLAFRILINYRSTSCVDREPTRSIARSLAPIGTRINHPIHTRNAGGERGRRFVATDNRPSSTGVLEFRIRPLEYHHSIDSRNVRSQNSSAKRDFISARCRPH